jgi:4-amino-4-deoxy-L-arabinose transferase-like glycosyltransferase
LSQTRTAPAPAPVRDPAPRIRPAIAVGAVLGILALTALLRLPSLSGREFNSDEAYLATQAQVLHEGGRLYVDTVDRKPPLVPYLYDAAFTVTGSDSLVAVRILAVVADATTALLLALIARNRFGSWTAGAIAALLFVVGAAALLPQDALTANFETFMLPFATAAMLLGTRRRPAAAGFSLAIATVAKQTAAAVLLPLAWLAWKARGRRGVLALGGAFAGTIVVTALAFGVHDFVFWVFTGNGTYLNAGGALSYGLHEAISKTWTFVQGHLVLVALVPFAWRYRKLDTDLWLWLAAGVVSVAAGLRFFGHYYLELLPPLALLATRTVVDRVPFRRPAVLAGLVALTILPALPFLVRGYTQKTGRDLQITTAVAAYVRAHTPSDARILVWGQAPEVYWQSDRRPATRFATTGFVTGSTGNRPTDDVGENRAVPGAWTDFLGDLRAHRPAMIVDMSTADQRGASKYPPAKFPKFSRYLFDGTWQRSAVVDGATIFVPARR